MEKQGTKKLDELDNKILAKLRQNAMKPFVKIARELGVTEGTIRLRVRRMSSDGIIRKFTIDVEAVTVGLPIIAFVSLSVSPGKIAEAADEMGKIDGIVEIHQTHTFGDLLVKLRAKDLTELGEILSNQLSKVKSVSIQSTATVLRIWKDGPL
jgi:Lrp/AsnC family transcriptional regulator for asnA, asnC and gidA